MTVRALQAFQAAVSDSYILGAPTISQCGEILQRLQDEGWEMVRSESIEARRKIESKPAPETSDDPPRFDGGEEVGGTFSAVPCPTCGGPCKVHTGDEGTSHFEPIRLDQGSVGEGR